MADNIFIVSRSQAVGKRTINGVQAIVINRDSGDSDATVISHAVTQANAAYAGTNSTSPFDADYFDTVVNITDLSAGALKDPNDAYVFADDAPPLKVEG